jgi:hypothetical protein
MVAVLSATLSSACESLSNRRLRGANSIHVHRESINHTKKSNQRAKGFG